MNRYYVKVENGQVIGKPQMLSDDRTASPNSLWKEEQLRVNGFTLVDLSCAENEYIDLDTPIVDGSSVQYNRRPKTAAMLEAEKEEKDKAKIRKLIDAKLEAIAIAALIADGVLSANGKLK